MTIRETFDFESPDFFTLGDLRNLCRSGNVSFTQTKGELLISFAGDESPLQFTNDYHGIQDAVGHVLNTLEPAYEEE